MGLSQFEIAVDKGINSLKVEKIADIDTGFAVDMDYLVVVNNKVMRIRVRGN